MTVERKEFLTSRDIAKELSYHIETIRRYLREGEIPAVKLGGQYRVRREDFERFLRDHRTTGSCLPGGREVEP
ncbi:MAG: helix-turn-helix domain-containing protein [Chloroflexota bacterium]|nr:helix-turn-helix domain-containing protein [Chloroflexota bacterium]